MDGEGVPHRMRTDRLADAGDAPGLLAGELDGVSGDWLAGYVTHKEPPLRPHGPVIAAQCFEQFGRKHNVPILLPFALLHAHDHSLAVDITGLEDRKSTRLNSSHANISYAVFCLKKKIRLPPRD